MPQNVRLWRVGKNGGLDEISKSNLESERQLEDWIKSMKGPESTISKTLEISKELLERIPDLPNVMDNANAALQMIAEGKLNINTMKHKNFEVEELKLKNLRNNMIIIFLGVVIGAFIVF